MALLVTRPAREAAAWVQQLQALGLAAQALPLIDIQPLNTSAALAASQARLAAGGYDAVMFVSSQAAQHFLPAIAHWPPHCRAWCPGPGTAHTLLALGVPAAQLDQPAAQAPQLDSEALWAVVGHQPQPGHNTLVVRGQDGLVPHADPQGQGRAWLAQQLRAAGGQVDFIAAYARCTPHWSPQQQATALASAQGSHLWLFSSSQALDNLRQLLPAQCWQQARAIATHPRIAAAAQAAGFGVVRLSQPSVQSVAQAVASIESGA